MEDENGFYLKVTAEDWISCLNHMADGAIQTSADVNALCSLLDRLIELEKKEKERDG